MTRLNLLIAATMTAAAAFAGAKAQDLPSREEQSFKAAAQRVAPSVVRIETVGGLDRGGQELVSSAPTSGLVVSSDGYIVTSAYAFREKPESILVRLGDGKRLAAKLVARDHSRMLVLLKVEPDAPLAAAQAASAAEIRVGWWAIAVGRTYEGPTVNLSVGIVSALDRLWGKAIQTDAKISPSNYGGPLVDISGRVMGILAPLPIDAGGQMTGTELYDSGIGFAVPLDQVNAALPRLKKGQNLHPGVLGVSLAKASDIAGPVLVAAVRPASPAAKAGIQAGDTIVEIAGQKIPRIADLKRQINRRYAGDSLLITVERAGKRQQVSAELVEQLPPYEQPFIGFLPKRPVGGAPKGLVVRYIYPASPAAGTGLKVDDRVTSCRGKPVESATTLRELLSTAAPGETLRLSIERGGKTQQIELKFGRQPQAIPEELPPLEPAAAGTKLRTGVVEIKLPEFPNKCVAYVPDDYSDAASYGVVVWLHGPGEFKQDEFVERWQDHAKARRLIVVAPQAADRKGWSFGEAQFARRVLDNVLKTYNIDRARIVVHGHKSGGTIAYALAFGLRELVRGLAVVESPLPPLAAPPDTDPVYPLSIYLASAAPLTGPAGPSAGEKRLRAMKYPVVPKVLGEDRYLNADELAELVRWIDTLDRL